MWSEEMRLQLVSLSTDAPGEELFTRRSRTAPNFKYMALSPVHLAINFEYAFQAIDLLRPY